MINSGFSFTDHSEATALQRLPGRALESVRGATPRHPAASGPLLTAEALSLTKRKPDSSVDEDIANLPRHLLCGGPSLRASLFQFNDLASLSLTLLDKGGCVWAFPPVLGLVAIRAAPGAGTLGSSPLGAQSRGPAPPTGLRLLLSLVPCTPGPSAQGHGQDWCRCWGWRGEGLLRPRPEGEQGRRARERPPRGPIPYPVEVGGPNRQGRCCREHSPGTWALVVGRKASRLTGSTQAQAKAVPCPGPFAPPEDVPRAPPRLHR